MEAGDKWAKLEEIVRRIIREELQAALTRHGRAVVDEIKQLPLFGKKAKIELVNGKWVGITAEQKEAWSAAYGAVDIEAELKRAAAWCVSNPAYAPKSQIGRFINTWLTREQNKKSLASIPMTRERPTEVKRQECAYCPKTATSSSNGIWACDDHSLQAMDGVKPMGFVRSVK